MQTVAVIDYGMSNLHSVLSALRHVSTGSTEIIVTADAQAIDAADRIVFPGQGAAADCMKHLDQFRLIPLVRSAMQDKPFLGICMGLQVLLSRSEENNGTECLGHFCGEVRAFSTMLRSRELSLKIPHMGWNTIRQKMDHPLWHNIPDESYFYFVHSYYVDPQDSGVVAGVTDYGIEFPSVIASGNVFAMQCHPEKSADSGLQILKNFLQWNGS